MPKYKHPDDLIDKKRIVYDLFHEVCEQFLSGNGSTIMRYKCDCGVWEYDSDSYEWRLNDKQQAE